MKILVYGAGVLGSLYAARLQEAGEEVWLAARGQRLADLQTHNIMLENEATGEVTSTRVSVIDNLASEDYYDLVIVLMRRNQVASILPLLAENTRVPSILFMTNTAAGPNELIRAVGRERVLLGFPGAGGAREGHVVRYLLAPQQPTSLGELDGQITSRLLAIAETFNAAGFPTVIRPDMDAWLKTHVALVSPVANALYLAGGDNYRLARTRDGLVLLVRAVREGFQVLRALGIPVTPPIFQGLEWIPEPLLVAYLQRMLNTRDAELIMARHANAARDEMKKLADEFQLLVRASGLPTPAIDGLYVYIDSSMPPARPGSAQLPLDTRSLWAGVALLSAVVLLWSWRRRR